MLLGIRCLMPLLLATTLCFAQQAALPIQPAPNYGRLPLTFEANQGQTASQAKFVSRGPGYTAYLTIGGMILSLHPEPVAGISPSISAGPRASVQLSLVNAAKDPVVVGEDPQPGKVNYFIGSDPTKWLTNIPTFGRIRYENIYPGVDLLYYGSHQQLEYDFEVQPGVDPGKIQFAIKGAQQMRLSPDGALILTLQAGEIQFQTPVVYQQSGNQRIPIDGSYQLLDSTHVAFRLGNYDVAKPLVIDPVLSYSTYLGGNGFAQANGIAVDSNGNVYVAGYTNSINFPLATLGSLPANANHIFVAKLNPSGTSLLYADYIGGNSEDYGVALVLDNQNDVYITGSTSSSNFPTVNAYQSQQPGPYSGFLTKVSASGSSLLYSTYLGGNTFDQPTAIAIDSLGEVYVTGYTKSQNFPVANAYQAAALANQGDVFGTYGFLTKFSTNGSSLVYSTYVAGNTDVAQSCGSTQSYPAGSSTMSTTLHCYPAPYSAMSTIAVDADENAYVAGTTNTNNFPFTPGAYLTSNTTEQDAPVGVVAKFSSAGALDYSTYFYGSSGNPISINAIAVDGSGSAFITGTAESDGTFPVTSTSICDPGTYGFGCSYAYVAKFDPFASTLLYSTFLGPNNYASPASIVLDANDDAYVLSSTSSPIFETNNAIEPYTGSADLLLVEIDPAASTQLFATYLGGSENVSPEGMILDASADIYVTGATNSTDFPVTAGGFQNQLAGSSNAFVAKISPASTLAVALNPYSLQFGAFAVGSNSQSDQVLLRNMSSGELTISSISTTGDFSESDNCVGTVAPAGSCTILATFTPTAAGTRTGSILINDNAAGSPQIVSLSGTGLGPAAGLTPTTVTFQSVVMGSSSTPQAVTLTNQGTTTLNIASIQISGDYAQTNNCPASLTANSACTFSVVFTPTATGNRTGMLSVADNAAGSPQTVALLGAGSDFSLATSNSTANVAPGATATYAVNVSSVGGAFSNAVKLACSGAPTLTTCSLSTASVTPGSHSATVTVSVATTGSSAELVWPARSRNAVAFAACMGFPSFGFLGLLVVGSGRRELKGAQFRGKKVAYVLILLAVLGMLLIITGCAGGTGIAPQNPGTAAGTYTITITGTSGSLQHSLPLTLTVQ